MVGAKDTQKTSTLDSAQKCVRKHNIRVVREIVFCFVVYHENLFPMLCFLFSCVFRSTCFENIAFFCLGLKVKSVFCLDVGAF